MQRWPWPGRALAGFALGLALLAGSVFAQEAARPPREGEKAPLFDIQGFDSRSLIGKKNLLLVFYRGHF